VLEKDRKNNLEPIELTKFCMLVRDIREDNIFSTIFLLCLFGAVVFIVIPAFNLPG
jgi:hypothetical protein